MSGTNKAIESLKTALAAATSRVEQAWQRLAKNLKTKGIEWDEYQLASREQLEAERALAAEKEEEYAIPLDFPCQWDTGAPLPYLLKNDYRTFVTFFLKEHDPEWDGSYVTIRDPSDPSPSNIAVVEFKQCVTAKMGSPNDEVHDGHPWAGRGMVSYSAQEVVNSRWIAEIESINSVHRSYSPERWKNLHHYVLWFHDSAFECIAESFHVSVQSGSLPEILAEICTHLLD